jgi:PAS domain S-box-containing protein
LCRDKDFQPGPKPGFIFVWTDKTGGKTLEDKSNLTEAQRALLDSEARTRAILDAAVDAIITIDDGGRIESVNPAALRLFGYEAVEMIGHNVKMLMPEPYYSEHDGYLEHYRKTGQKKIIGIGREVVGRRKDGSTFPMHLAVSELQLGNRRMYTGIARNITDIKRAIQLAQDSEARTRAILETAVDAIITIDERGMIESVNPAAQKVFGHAAHEMIGRNVKMLMPEPYHSEHDAYLLNYRQTGHKKIIGIGREVIGRRKDGTTFPMELGVSEVRLGDRRIFTGIVRDITERKLAEEALREANRRKDEFMAMLAHELRNPLAPIQNAAHLLNIGGDKPDMIRKMQEIIARQAKHLAHLVDDLLDVSRITRGKISLRMEKVNLLLLMQQVLRDFTSRAEAAGIRLDAQLPERPLWVMGDPTRLVQIVDNLLSNAIKFTDRGGNITLSLRPVEQQAVIQVTDTGIGIEPEMLHSLFEPFSQADRSLARSQGGLGLGLALVKGLVALHEGQIEVGSGGPGMGASFTVRLRQEAEPPAVSELPPEPLPPTGRPLRFLVVEDNLDAAESLRIIVSLMGHQVDVVHTGLAALTAAAEKRPEVVLCDIGLPGMDGFAVAAALRQRPETRQALLVAITGYGQEIHDSVLQCGFDLHMVKPVDPKTLMATIRNWEMAHKAVH